MDDIILTGSCSVAISEVKNYLQSHFKLKYLGHLHYFLGIEIPRSPEGIYLHQRKYGINLMKQAGLLGSKPSTITLPTQHNLHNLSGTPLTDGTSYRRLVGQLIYLTVTRPELSYPVHILSQFMSHPTDAHWDAAIKLVKLVKVSSCLQKVLCLMLGNSLLSWKCKKQNVVSRSSAEAEYRSMANALCEVKWIYNLLSELHFKIPRPIPLFCDNTSAIRIAENPVLHERTKHIDLDCHLIRDHVKTGFLQPQYLSTQVQPADLFTKALNTARTQFLLTKLGAMNIFTPPNFRGNIDHNVDRSKNSVV